MLTQRRRGGRGQPVGAPPVLARERLDEAEPLEPVQRLVQRSRREPHAGELLDVLRQRPAVLRALGKAREDQSRGSGDLAFGHGRDYISATGISSNGLYDQIAAASSETAGTSLHRSSSR